MGWITGLVWLARVFLALFGRLKSRPVNFLRGDGLSNEQAQRLDDLETRVAFQEQLIDQLNDALGNQDMALLELKRTLKLLGERLQQLESGGPGELIDTPPPHY